LAAHDELAAAAAQSRAAAVVRTAELAGELRVRAFELQRAHVRLESCVVALSGQSVGFQMLAPRLETSCKWKCMLTLPLSAGPV
jgi:hypothetical protein